MYFQKMKFFMKEDKISRKNIFSHALKCTTGKAINLTRND